MRIGIVGCGVVGAAIAYRLSQDPSYDIQVWESRSQEEFGSTGAALGVLMAVISPKLKGKHLRMRLESIGAFDGLIDELEAQTGLTIPYNRQGIVQLMFDQGQFDRWEKTEAVRQRQGFTLERWSREEVIEKYPAIQSAKEIKTGNDFVGAVYSPCDRQLDPVALTQACRKAAEMNGAKIHYDASVESFDVTSDDTPAVHQVNIKGESIQVDRLIISAGLGATSLTASLEQRIPIRPVLGQAIRYRLKNHDFALPNPVMNGAHVHLIPLNSDEFWVGATVEFPDEETGELNEPSAEALETIKQQAIALYPKLADAEIVDSWTGLRPRPMERAAPVIEWLPNYDNVLIATAHYRNGVLLAPVTATKVAEMLSERTG